MNNLTKKPIRGITYDEQRLVDMEDRVIKLTEASKKVLETKLALDEIPIGAYARQMAFRSYERSLEDLKAVVESRGLSTSICQTSEQFEQIKIEMEAMAERLHDLRCQTEVRYDV